MKLNTISYKNSTTQQKIIGKIQSPQQLKGLGLGSLHQGVIELIAQWTLKPFVSLLQSSSSGGGAVKSNEFQGDRGQGHVESSHLNITQI